MEPITVALSLLLLSLLAYLVHIGRKNNKFWEERGIPSPKPLLFLGNSAPLLLMRKHVGVLHQEIANQFPNEPLVGLYDFTKPILLINDPDLVEKVLIKDFVYFTDHGFPLDRRNAFNINLFTLTGKEWRALRYKLTPLFTSGKLKQMYGIMAECGDQMTKLLDSNRILDLEMKEILGRFAMDVIGSCAFGIDAGNLSKPDNQFRRMGRKTFEFGVWQLLKFAIISNFPNLGRLFKLSFTDHDVGNYFCNIIKDTVEYRRKNNVYRNDFLQLLMVLKEKGSIEIQIKDPADDYLKMDPTYSTESFEMSEDMMIGQAFTFLSAGFEATASTITFALYELGKNTEIQERVRKEIKQQVGKAGSLSYDIVKQMTYLEQCVKETLRKYPPAPTLMRVCTKEYTLPNGITITPGQSVGISLRALHCSSKYFSEPEEFHPERFDIDQKIPRIYLPFGNGPRICIAMRFALMEINYCLAKLLMNYDFKISPKSKPLELSARGLFTASKYPILFNITKIATSP